MKSAIIIGLLLVMHILPVASAVPDAPDRGFLKVRPVPLQRQGDSLYIRMTIDAAGVEFRPQGRVSFTPVLHTPGRSVNLPQVHVEGRNIFKDNRRSHALMSQRERMTYYRQFPDGGTLRGFGGNGGNRLEYSKAVRYEPWMEHATLNVIEVLSGMGNAAYTVVIENLMSASGGGMPTTADPGTGVGEVQRNSPVLAFIRPVVEAVKSRSAQAEVYLDFPYGRSAILPDYRDNARELLKIYRIVDTLRRSREITVNRVTISGYTSPEGSYETNLRLSQQRADALRNYLISRYAGTSGNIFNRADFHIEACGENWDGLTKLLTERPFPYKSEILSIVGHIPVMSGREKMLMDLGGGNPYHAMQREIFPLLRVVSFRIDYTVAGFDLQRAREEIGIRPQDMSQHEMWMVAESYGEGSEGFARTMDIAAKTYPEDDTANVNAAAAALSRGDTYDAEGYLEKVRFQGPEYKNAMGTLLWLRGDRTQAEPYFRTAAMAGLPEAKANLTRFTSLQP